MKECLNCTEWRMRGSGLMRFGLGRCAVQRPFAFTQPHHSCAAHASAPRETIDARAAWLEKHGLIPTPATREGDR
jgi:hypothetical protein